VKSFVVGLDLGQVQDFTAIVVLERDERPTGKLDANGAPLVMLHHDIRHIERPALGTSYPTIVARVKEMLEMSPLLGHTHLVVDATGVGVAVVDLLKAARLQVQSCRWVTITGGEKVTSDGMRLSIPKRDLVGVLQVVLQTGRLKIADGLPLAKLLTEELLGFQVKISEAGRDSYGAWREGAHDDLVLATALACWLSDRGRVVVGPPIKYGFGSPTKPKVFDWQNAGSIFVDSTGRVRERVEKEGNGRPWGATNR
jgi:hypothetical protein